jgi:sec-independent protein translocase protein TatC
LPLTLGRFFSEDPDRPRFTLSVLEHLDRFRKAVIRSCAGVAIGVLIAFAYINPIVDFVFRPIRGVLPEGSKLIDTVPGEAFSVYVEIALIAGVVLMSPFIMYQVWQLIAPALYLKEKKFALWFILMTSAGFIGGAAFNHYVAFKMLILFFASFNSAQLAFLPRLDDVFDMYTRMLFIMGVVFQMPTLVFFLAKMGLVTSRFLASQFKYAVLVIFIIAAVVTPSGDPYNQTILAAPMVGLYILSIFIAWVFGPVAKKKDKDEADDLD